MKSKTNPVAKEVRTPKFKSQVIKNKKVYDRKTGITLNDFLDADLQM